MKPNVDSIISVGQGVNGSDVTFNNLDAGSKYLVRYNSTFGVYRVNQDGTSGSAIRYSFDGSNFTNVDNLSNTIRSSGSGADDTTRTHNYIFVFSGKTMFTALVGVYNSNAAMNYRGGATSCELLKIVNDSATSPAYPTNV